MTLDRVRVGFALTGSFCTFGLALAILEEIVSEGAAVTPILSHIAATADTRFMKAADLKTRLAALTGRPAITAITEAEPIGPGLLLDVLLILPCTGNTLAKLAGGVADTPVTMAAKSHLRNNRPVVLGISTNDALGRGAANIGALLNARDIYFVPFGQDDPAQKPRSMMFRREHVLKALRMALQGRQAQPILA